MTAQINGIPVFSATLETDECGIYRVSFVDLPAVESDFIALAAKKPQMYSVVDDEKRLVRGVLMRADFPIYRFDWQMGEYYIVYHADVIRQMAEKFLSEGRVNEVNQMHIPFSEVRGVVMHQIFIKDTAAGVSPVGFEDIADGSLFVEYFVKNDDVWASVKDGTYKGFSLEGIFTFQPEPAHDDEAMLSQITNLIKQKKMTIIDKIKAALAEAVQLKNVTTDKGVISWEGDEDLAVGVEVFIEDAEGNRAPAEDGDYKLDDGTIVKVEGGKVAEILEPEADIEGEEEAPQEGEETPDALTALEERVKALEDIVKELQTAMTEMSAGTELIAQKVGKLMKEPAAKPIKEQHKEEEGSGYASIDKLRSKLPKRK